MMRSLRQCETADLAEMQSRQPNAIHVRHQPGSRIFGVYERAIATRGPARNRPSRARRPASRRPQSPHMDPRSWSYPARGGVRVRPGTELQRPRLWLRNRTPTLCAALYFRRFGSLPRSWKRFTVRQ
jgi:hypothetical protein